MKAITLHQPWASMIAVGAKRIETRAWSTRHRGPLAIHAAKSFPEYAQAFALTSRFVRARLDDAELISLKIPFGAIVAVAQLVEVVPTQTVVDSLSQEERALGDYAAGRWAWLLAKIEPLTPPIECRGGVGLWDFFKGRTWDEIRKDIGR
ncbi:MAG TPA: ASCH domain-containing protein [Candidatus Dormibacteraeota bacterium]|jgi:hypothetical protein|nr:ASCH domain-containing protein [Candidatus Dormibacteraeota bacterium]